MKNLFLKFIFILYFFSIINSINAQFAKYSNDYLNIGVGAKYLGLSNCAVAIVDDANSTFWNPAGLTQLKNNLDVSLMHSEYFAGIAKYDFMSVAYKINDSSALAVSVIRLGIDDIQNTLNLFDSEGNIDYSKIELFSVADYAMLLSYAKKTKIEGLTIGANTKIIYRHQGQFANAYGFGLDAGIQYNKNKWHFGILGKDITSTFNAWFINSDQLIDIFTETENEIPKNSLEITMPRLIAGIARDFKLSDKIWLTAISDIDFTFDGRRNVLINSKPISIDPHLGLDFNYKKIVYLRTGINNIQMIPDFITDSTGTKNKINFQPNLGIGLKIKNFSLDYAITDIGNQAIGLYSNIFSVNYRF